MKRVSFAWKLAAAAGLFGGALIAGAEPRPADQTNPTDTLKNLELREIGPAVMGGRIDDFAVVESNPSIVFVGVASGGVWKTSNNGTTWTRCSTKRRCRRLATLRLRRPTLDRVGRIGRAEQPAEFVVGRRRVQVARRRKDLAEHGLRATHHIGRVVIHPRNPDVVYVAQRAICGAESGARRLQDDGRRKDLDAGLEDK